MGCFLILNPHLNPTFTGITLKGKAMETVFLQATTSRPWPQFLTSLAIGLLIGLERER